MNVEQGKGTLYVPDPVIYSLHAVHTAQPRLTGDKMTISIPQMPEKADPYVREILE